MMSGTEERLPLLHHAIDGEARDDFFGARAESFALVAIVHQAIECGGERGHAVRTHEQAVDAVAHDRTHAGRAIGGDDGKAAGHRLAERVRETFRARGLHVEVGARERGGGVGCEAGEGYAGLRFEAQWTFAVDFEVPVSRSDAGEGFEEEVVAFLGGEAAQGDEKVTRTKSGDWRRRTPDEVRDRGATAQLVAR